MEKRCQQMIGVWHRGRPVPGGSPCRRQSPSCLCPSCPFCPSPLLSPSLWLRSARCRCGEVAAPSARYRNLEGRIIKSFTLGIYSPLGGSARHTSERLHVYKLLKKFEKDQRRHYDGPAYAQMSTSVLAKLRKGSGTTCRAARVVSIASPLPVSREKHGRAVKAAFTQGRNS